MGGQTGSNNAITDVPGVEVGYHTIIRDAASRAPSTAVRTGVTAILPRGKQTRMHPIWAGTFSLNGNGEMTGVHWIADGGYFLGPVCITNTHSVGIVHDAAVRWMLLQYKEQFDEQHLWALPVVAETYDGVLNDINGQHVRAEDALRAIASATAGPVAEGNVGGGTGMICYGFKGGSGTSSRLVEIAGTAYHVGAFVQANFGLREQFTVLGVPVGRHLPQTALDDRERGSVIVVIGTDIPMLPHQLRRVAKRAALGIARTGTSSGNSSGDIFLAFSTANEMEIPQSAAAHLRMDFVNDEAFDPIYDATCAAVEESVVNALLAAEPMTAVRPAGLVVPALDSNELLAIMRRYGRIPS
ncbi:MAG: P1 family peptidase [Thermaerobacter sp.]|nr:P1 family peptidase [Thermaerobacter sp.]